jgi:hypothetical protein
MNSNLIYLSFFRRKSFFLTHRSCMKFKCHKEIGVHCIQHLIIREQFATCQCIQYFPKVTKVTLYDSCIDSNWFTDTQFSSIMSLTQLNSLTIYTSMIKLNVIVDMLRLTPNVHTITFTFTTMRGKELSSLQESETFQYVASHNRIKAIVFKQYYTMKIVQIMMNLCPRLQYLVFVISQNSLDPTFRYLLTETNQTTRDRFSICIYDVNAKQIEKLQTMIESQELVNNYLIKIVNDKFYFKWWY